VKVSESYEKGTGRIDYRVFIPSVLIILVIAIPLSIDPKLGYGMVQASFNFVTKYFGWLAMLIPPACIAFILWLSFGPYAKVKLGGPDDKPEFSTFSWVAMLFCCGIGSSIIIWGVAEPIYYIDGPPLNLEPRSIAAYGIAHALPTYHWGIHGWAIYTVGTLAITYSIYVRKAPRLRLSTSCEPILGERVKTGWGAAIEVLVVVGTVGGFGTSLGLGVPFISTFVAQLFGIDDTVAVKAGVLILWTCIFGWSAYRGLNRGILVLSNINIVLVMLVLLFILVVGPTLFILDLTVNSLYTMFSNFVALSFSMEPFNLVTDEATGAMSRGQGFPQWWPIFYWFWFIALMPITAIFIARISKGRTIRQVALGTTLWAALGCFIILSILGGYSLWLQYTGELDVAAILAKNSPGSTAAMVLSHVPMAKLMTPLYIIMAMVFLATTLDSASYALASICTYEIKGDQQPARSLRLTWAMILGIFSVGLLITSGEGALRTIQTSSVVLGLPLIIACFGLALSLVLALRKDFPPVDDTLTLEKKK
jgi:BCCT family betaine/carnitine transporter